MADSRLAIYTSVLVPHQILTEAAASHDDASCTSGRDAEPLQFAWRQHSAGRRSMHWGCWGASGSSRLASLSTSAVRQNMLPPNLKQIRIGSLPTNVVFQAQQAMCADILEYQQNTNQGFPRPCGGCGDNAFMTRDGKGVVEWSSRPCVCEQCAGWFHLGCMRVQHLEDVPSRPWFHCDDCKELYLRLEATAALGPLPTTTPGLSMLLTTDMDHRKFRLEQAYNQSLSQKSLDQRQQGQATSGSGAGDDSLGSSRLSRGDPRGAGMQAVAGIYRVLQASFTPDMLQGFGEEAREYDGGKYAALLLRQSASPGLLKGTLQPVSAATLNFTGSTAQLHLLATLPEERGKGYATTLLSSIEGLASTLGMEEIVTQPRRKMLSKYVEDFGYSVATPLEALVLHRSVPLAYYDCVVVRKSLAV